MCIGDIYDRLNLNHLLNRWISSECVMAIIPSKALYKQTSISLTNTSTNKTVNQDSFLVLSIFSTFQVPLTKQVTETMAPTDITTGAANVTNAQSKAGRRAFVTFLAGNGDYVKGVVGLAKGLRKVKSIYPLVVAVLPDVPEEHRKILTSQGCIVREIRPVYPPKNQTQFAMAYYVINYSKLRIWEVCTLYVILVNLISCFVLHVLHILITHTLSVICSLLMSTQR